MSNAENRKTVIKSGLIKDMGILCAITLLIIECFWFSGFYSGENGWMQAPLPDYKMLIQGIHFWQIAIGILCLIGFFKPMRLFWNIFKYAIFLYQGIIVSFTTVYWIRYGYAPGGGLADVFMVLSGVPLLAVLFLMLSRRKGMPGGIVCGVIIFDLVIYFLGDFFYAKMEMFNFFAPYPGFLLKSLWAGILVSYISCFGRLDEED